METGLNINNAATKTQPKKLSPFLLFVKHRKPYLEVQIPGICMKDILFQAGQEWHKLTEQQKQVYRDESTLIAAQNAASAAGE